MEFFLQIELIGMISNGSIEVKDFTLWNSFFFAKTKKPFRMRVILADCRSYRVLAHYATQLLNSSTGTSINFKAVGKRLSTLENCFQRSRTPGRRLSNLSISTTEMRMMELHMMRYMPVIRYGHLLLKRFSFLHMRNPKRCSIVWWDVSIDYYEQHKAKIKRAWYYISLQNQRYFVFGSILLCTQN